MEKRSGIYVIRNTVNGKRYVGQSTDVAARFCGHRYDLRRNESRCTALQVEWNEYGESAFTFDVLFFCSASQLTEQETVLLNAEPLPEYNTQRTVGIIGRGHRWRGRRTAVVAIGQDGLVRRYETITSAARDGFDLRRLMGAIVRGGTHRGFVWRMAG